MEILGTERLTNHKWINLFSRRYSHNGQEGRWIFASRHAEPRVPADGFNAVIIVPVLLSEGQPPRLVVIREYRIPIGDYEYGFPAGLVEPGENIEEAARRELKEETGFDVIEVTKVSPPVYSSTGLCDEAVVMVFVTARATPQSKQALEGTEVIEVLPMDYRQVCELCDSNKRISGKGWPILYMYQQLGKLA